MTVERRDKLDALINYQERVRLSLGLEVSREEAIARLVSYRPELADAQPRLQLGQATSTPVATNRDASANGTPT